MDNNRYRLPTDRLINCLTPHYLSGRRYILLLQSLVWPLQSLNDRFCAWARERQIEARMTSQVMWFEWWLNYRFRRYFRDASDAIYHTARRGPLPRGCDGRPAVYGVVRG